MRRAFLLLSLAAAPLPAQGRDTLRLPGLTAPVEIVRDSAGINHIFARNEHDLFFAQGFAVARDRLVQLEIWRRRATGTFAEALGPAWVERDRAARQFRFRGDMARELAHYHPRGGAIVRAFVDGINAWVAQVERDPSLAPPELRALGLAPGRWTPEVVVSRHNALSYNSDEEIDAAKAVQAIGTEAYRRVVKLAPEPVELAIPAGLDVDALGPEVLRRWELWRSTPTFGARPGAADRGNTDGPLRADPPPDEPLPDERAGRIPPEGSNNWVIAGRRTASGKPFMANDPHRAITSPSLRSWVHLVAPGWDVVGGGEPAVPGVAIGHNRHGAWGLTIFILDQEDIYTYRLDSADRERYRDGATWRRFELATDTIRVKGEAPRAVTLRWARHGPVLHVDSARGIAYAMRAAMHDIGAAPYMASLRIDQARTWAEFRAALGYHRLPALNWVWADTSGTIGWQVAGAAPIRRGWSGLTPVPASGQYEWGGLLPVAQLPHVVNPPGGAFGTANEMNVPAGYAHPEAVGRWWEQWRARRLDEVFAADRTFTRDDMMRLQYDETSLAARAHVPLLRGVTSDDPLVRQALDSVRAWDHRLAAGSVAAGIYRAWEPRLHRAVLDRSVPAAARRWVPYMSSDLVLEALASPDARFGADPVKGRDSLVAATFAATVTSLRDRFGPDLATWQLGRTGYQQVAITHAAAPVADSALRARLEVGPAPRGGGGNVLHALGGSGARWSGASFRIVVDLSDWDAAVGTNTPGMVGDSRSPHYRDLFDDWIAGRYFPVPYTRPAVDRRAEQATWLVPSGAARNPTR